MVHGHAARPARPAGIVRGQRGRPRLLDRLPVDERIPFALRAIDGMDLREVASACGVSVPTVRRRLARAERRFFALAANCESLLPWMRTT